MKTGVITNATDWRSHALQGRCKFQGLPLSIENERGSYRQGVDEHGKPWRTFMATKYGYIRATEGVDGDCVDVYVGDNPFSNRVFIIHQNDPVTGSYDEDKIILGVGSPEEAKARYLRQYDRPDYFGSMEEVDMATFKKMLKEGKGIKLKKIGSKKSFSNTRTSHAKSAGNLADSDALVKKSKGNGSIKLENTRCEDRDVTLFKSFDNAVSIDSKVKGDSINIPSRSLQSDSLIQIPFKRTHVLSPMNALRHKLKIGDNIVKSVLVTVVNDFSRKQRPSEMTLHNNPMLKTLLSSESDQSVLSLTSKGSDMPSHVRSSHDNPPIEAKYDSSSKSSQEDLSKSKRMPIGTISRGRKKVAEGKWVDVPKGKGSAPAFKVGQETVLGTISGIVEMKGQQYYQLPRKGTSIVDLIPFSHMQPAIDMHIKNKEYRERVTKEEAARKEVIRQRDDTKGFFDTFSNSMQAGKARKHLLEMRIKFQGKPMRNKEFGETLIKEGFTNVYEKGGKYRAEDSKGIFFDVSITVAKYIKHLQGSLEKSKYTRKYWKNGRWNYVYPEDGSRRPRPIPEFKVQRNLGGTTGGVFLIEMANGERKVMKQSTSPKHLLDEYTANRVYKILGVPVPNVSLHGTDKGVAQVHDYIEGTPLGDLDPESRQQAIESLKRGFVADALLGNWDVLGLDEDNILWDGSKAWRIDNGGALRYRAQGAAKGDMFGRAVGEIETMRDRDRQAGQIFGEVSETEIADQVRNVMAHRQIILQAIEDPHLRAIMEARIGSLKGYLEPVIKAKKMPVGTISHGRKKVAEGKWVDVPKKKTTKRTAKKKSNIIIVPVRDQLGRLEKVELDRNDPLAQLYLKKVAAKEDKKKQLKQGLKKLEKLGIKNLKEVHLHSRKNETGYATLKRIVGESIADMLMREEEIRAWQPPSGKKYQKALLEGVPETTLLQKNTGEWYLYENNKLTRFWWFHGLEKAIKTKTYYSPEEVKARGMRWVTIRGARVLIQGTADGGWVVVGGAGGKLNHLKIDKILSEEEYAGRRKKVEQKRKEELRSLSKEELAEQTAQRRAEVKAKRVVREQYTAKVTEVLGITQEEIRSEVTAKQMDELAEKARIMVEGRASSTTMDAKAIDKEIDKQTDKEIEKAIQKRVKDVERQALETLMNDYMPSDPNAKSELKKLLDPAKALEVLAARKAFRKEMKKIGKGAADIPTNLKVGDIFAAVSAEDYPTIEQEVRDQIETQKNIRFYDTLNAQSLSIQKHIDEGVISALNGLIGDIYGVGATFSADTVEQLGLEAIVRAVTIKLQQDGKGDVVRKALEEYAATEREKVVTEALKESEKRFKNAETLRSLARDTDDAEAILSMASANGHALKQLTAGQRTLGTAAGSLRAVAHLINALEEPPADVIQIDIGKDLARARKKAKKSGLPKGSYSIKTMKEGRGKRLVLEIKKDQLNTFFERNANMRQEESEIDKIKMHKANDGYIPPGIKPNIKLDPAQEAGLRFFKEQGKVILDFEAGLGKTAIGYAAAMEAIHNKGAKKVLVVTPAKLRGQMFEERKTFLDEENQKIVMQANENVSKAKRLERYEKDGIMIVGHDQLRTDAAAIKAAGYDMIIIDEIHEVTAGAGKAGRYKGMQSLQDIPLKIGMSGTNIKNKKNELYRKISFIDPDHTLGTPAEFEKRYKGLNQGTGMFSDAANDAFRKEIAQWVYTQKNALPVKNNIESFRIPLTTAQRKKYAESERTYRDERAKKVPGAAARRDSRNYEIVTDAGAVDNAKLNHMVDIMKKSHGGEKAVIHVSRPGVPVRAAMNTAAKRLKAEFGDDSVGMIHGESSPGEVAKLKKRFNNPDDPLRFIIGTKSLESGHNLQGGGTVTFHLDIPDSYAAFEQRNARVFRKGQDKDTKTYVLSGLNPYDMRGEDILETKRKEQGILGNPREIESMDDTGFLGMLNKYEAEAQGAKA